MGSIVRCLALVALAVVAVPPVHAQEAEPAVVVRARLVERIGAQLAQIADDARGLDDPALRLACQSQAAALLWPREPDRAREIYAAAFDALLPAASASADERTGAAKLLSELLSNVARHDPGLAERFANRLALLPHGDEPSDDARDRAEWLANAAIEMLPKDPARAASIGRLALGEQVTPAFMRLLVVLRGVDPKRADALFGDALAVLARNPNPRLSDVQMLGFYIGSNGQSVLAGVPQEAVRAYLELAFRLVTIAPLDSGDASSAYFLGRQLQAAFGRYLPERSAELEARIGLLSHSSGFQTAAARAAADAQDGAQADSEDAQRVRAATAAIERDDYKTAHSEAAAIEDDGLQSRVYAQAALHLVKLRRLDEAAREIGRVPDPARRAMLLIQLAHVAHARGDLAYAVESLAHATREALRADDSEARLQALFSIASAFVDVDPLRAFDTMKTAIDGVNKAVNAVDTDDDKARATAPSALNFDATLARLARVDFDRALLLAQQFDPLGHRLLAELSVCRGGLASAGFTEIAEQLDDGDPA